jgi:hypothetical protein
MAKYLVVAHQTAASGELITELKQLAGAGNDAEFDLLVPATPIQHLLTSQDEGAEQVAQKRAEEAKAALELAGLNVTRTSVGAALPLDAIEAELRKSDRRYTAIVISTFPPGLSKWLRRGLPWEVERRFGLPVVHVVARDKEIPNRPAPEREGLAAPRPWVWDLRGIGAWRGKPLFSSDGFRVGMVEEILYDSESSRPEWLRLATGFLGIRSLLLPAVDASPGPGGLVCGHTLGWIAGQPHVDVGEGIDSLTDEHQIYAYFGLPFDPRRDLRALRPHAEYPGSFSYPRT